MDAKKTIAIVLLVCLCVIVGWFGRGYYDDRAADRDNALGTIQQIKTDNESIRNDIGDAAAQIDDAQSALDGGQADIAAAAGRVNELQSRADADAAIITDCQKLLEVGRKQLAEARRIVADVDRENSGGGTQSHGST